MGKGVMICLARIGFNGMLAQAMTVQAIHRDDCFPQDTVPEIHREMSSQL